MNFHSQPCFALFLEYFFNVYFHFLSCILSSISIFNFNRRFSFAFIFYQRFCFTAFLSTFYVGFLSHFGLLWGFIISHISTALMVLGGMRMPNSKPVNFMTKATQFNFSNWHFVNDNDDQDFSSCVENDDHEDKNNFIHSFVMIVLTTVMIERKIRYVVQEKQGREHILLKRM